MAASGCGWGLGNWSDPGTADGPTSVASVEPGDGVGRCKAGGGGDVGK